MKCKCFAVAFVLVTAPSVFAGNAFQVQGFPLPPGYISFENPSVNQSGQVAVTAYSSALDNVNLQFEGTPFLWNQGQLTSLPLAGRVWGSTSGINSAGAVVGYTVDAAGSLHPAMWANGALTNLPQGGMAQGEAFSINDGGQISGSTFDVLNSNVSQAVIWDGGILSSLGNFGSEFAAALAINNRSQVVVATSNGVLLYDQGQATPVIVSGLATNSVYGANNAGQLTGNEDLETAYVWQGGKAAVLPDLPGTGYVTPWAINDEGEIVGTTELAGDYQQVPTLWRDGVVYDLNDLIDPASGWTLGSATDITDDGTIVGIGGYDGRQQIFILTPTADGGFAASGVPEPASLAILALGSAMLLRRRRD